MNTSQRLLDLAPRTLLRLSEVERLIRIHRILVPAPSRRYLHELCENGTFETAERSGKREIYLIFEDSFIRWVASLMGASGEMRISGRRGNNPLTISSSETSR